ncbi:MAG: RsmD family RNA methyltransferase [Bacillota bacterium]
MSSINPYFTFNYSQPEEYRFSHDSVFLARRVFEFYRDKDLASLKGLDLCAGCGVIGLEFLFHCRKECSWVPYHFDFLEVQAEIYRPHFEKNVASLGPIGTQIQFKAQNYADLLKLSVEDQYDLILCNPPYFHLGQGTLSPSSFKNRCRFFLDADFTTLLQGIEKALRPGGRAYVLLREQSQHGWSVLDEIGKVVSPQIKVRNLEDIRGTGFVEFTKDV